MGYLLLHLRARVPTNYMIYFVIVICYISERGCKPTCPPQQSAPRTPMTCVSPCRPGSVRLPILPTTSRPMTAAWIGLLHVVGSCLLQSLAQSLWAVTYMYLLLGELGDAPPPFWIFEQFGRCPPFHFSEVIFWENVIGDLGTRSRYSFSKCALPPFKKS